MIGCVPSGFGISRPAEIDPHSGPSGTINSTSATERPAAAKSTASRVYPFTNRGPSGPAMGNDPWSMSHSVRIRSCPEAAMTRERQRVRLSIGVPRFIDAPVVPSGRMRASDPTGSSTATTPGAAGSGEVTIPVIWGKGPGTGTAAPSSKPITVSRVSTPGAAESTTAVRSVSSTTNVCASMSPLATVVTTPLSRSTVTIVGPGSIPNEPDVSTSSSPVSGWRWAASASLGTVATRRAAA